MKHRPLLSDARATKTRYNAGDKILATITTDINPDHRRRIVKSVRYFAGAEVDVFIINKSKWRVVVIPPQQPPFSLFEPATKTEESKLGVANIGLTKVVFEPGSLVLLYGQNFQKMQEGFKRWAGDSVEIADGYKFGKPL